MCRCDELITQHYLYTTHLFCTATTSSWMVNFIRRMTRNMKGRTGRSFQKTRKKMTPLMLQRKKIKKKIKLKITKQGFVFMRPCGRLCIFVRGVYPHVPQQLRALIHCVVLTHHSVSAETII